jgi:hypothetical protein
MMYWPWPPMLNSPQRNAKATARPVSTSGTVTSSVCCRLYAAWTRAAPETQGKSHSSPVPLKIAWYVPIGFLWVVAKTTSPPTANASAAVMRGVTIPPARW